MQARTGIAFAAPYWSQQVGVRHTRQALGDPAVQIEDERLRRRHLVERWDRLGVPVPDQMRRDVDQVAPLVRGYGVATVPMILGCEGVFSEAFDPYARPLDLGGEAVFALTPQTDFSDNPVMQDLEAQAAWLVRAHGRARIAINMQSVPNIAFKIRGEQLMFDFYENPELVHRLVDWLQQTWVSIRAYISRVNERNGCPDGESMVSLDNCTVALLSPQIYREFFLPYDRRTAAQYPTRYGVHHCGGNMHLFATDYGSIGQGVWFDIGYGSHVRSCMEHLKTGEAVPRWSVRYGPAKLRSADAGEIRQERDALLACGPDVVNCIGADPETPEENLKAFLVP